MDKEKLLSPWTRSQDITNIWYRYCLKRNNVVKRTITAWIRLEERAYENGALCMGRIVWPDEKKPGRYREYSNSLEELQHRLDKKLENNGYMFLLQQEWDKYQLLM